MVLRTAVLAAHISELLAADVRAERQGGSIVVRLDGVDRPYGFQIRLSEGLGRVEVEVELDRLAGGLLRLLQVADIEVWENFKAFVASVSSICLGSEIRVNDRPVEDPPGTVQSMRIWLTDRVKENEYRTSSTLVALAASLLLALLPADDTDSSVAIGPFQPEGGKSRREVNHYERSRSNRAIAIAIHGDNCQVCHLSFGAVYGVLGEGYIEVHHLEPVHAMEARRVIDPRTELVPLCANCHRMAHRRVPPYSPEELRLAIEATRSLA